MKILFEHNFYLTYLGGIETHATIFNPETKENEEIQLWDPKSKPLAWEYLTSVGNVFTNLCNTIEELYLTTNLISETDKLAKITNSSCSTTINYLIKNWILRYVSIYEVSLCLINEVMDLGYLNKTITKNNLENNKHIILNKTLNKLREEIRKLIEQRLIESENKRIENINNEIKHLGKFSFTHSNDISWFELINRWGKYKDENDFKIDLGLKIQIIDSEFQARNDEILNSVVNLLDYLDSIFTINFNDLKK